MNVCRRPEGICCLDKIFWVFTSNGIMNLFRIPGEKCFFHLNGKINDFNVARETAYYPTNYLLFLVIQYGV